MILEEQCFTKIDIGINKQTLIEKFHLLSDEFGISLYDYFTNNVSDPNTWFVHPPVDLVCDVLDLPFVPDDVRFCKYQDSDLFVHKDNRMKSRLSIRLSGQGDLFFYEEDRKTVVHSTGLDDWTLINTQINHGVSKTKDRLSFQFGFAKYYEEMLEELGQVI